MKKTKNLKVEVSTYGHAPIPISVSRCTTVTTQLSRALADATPDDPILINAGTGFGKTTAALEAVILPEHERRKKLLAYGEKPPPTIWFISPRAAINLQFKRRLAAAVEVKHLLVELTAEGLRRHETFGPVRVMTFHSLWNKLKAKGEDFSTVKYLIFDEIHSLVLDSTFVGYTGELLTQIPKVFARAQRIYLSATPEPVLPSLRQAEHPLTLTTHNWPKKYDHFQLHFYQSYRNVADYFHTLPADEKALIFVPTIAEGEALIKQLGGGSLITSKTRQDGSEKWTNLLNGAPLEHRFTVATSVLDAGVSITDPKLKHIVCSGLDIAEILQQAGRKRLASGETLNLYIWSPTLKQISQLLEQVRAQQDALTLYPTSLDRFYDLHILKDKRDAIRNLCYASDGQIIPNSLASEYLSQQEAYYIALLKSRNTWPVDAAVCKFLHQKLPVDKCRWLDGRYNEDHEAILRSWLNSKVNQPMDKPMQEDFSAKFKELYQAAFGPRANDRSDRSWGLSVIKTVLQKLNWGFSMESKSGIWRLTSVCSTLKEAPPSDVYYKNEAGEADAC